MAERWPMLTSFKYPRAYRWQVMRCGGDDCRHPHLVFFDENDNLICDAVQSRSHRHVDAHSAGHMCGNR